MGGLSVVATFDTLIGFLPCGTHGSDKYIQTVDSHFVLPVGKFVQYATSLS